MLARLIFTLLMVPFSHLNGAFDFNIFNKSNVLCLAHLIVSLSIYIERENNFFKVLVSYTWSEGYNSMNYYVWSHHVTISQIKIWSFSRAPEACPAGDHYSGIYHQSLLHINWITVSGLLCWTLCLKNLSTFLQLDMVWKQITFALTEEK